MAPGGLPGAGLQPPRPLLGRPGDFSAAAAVAGNPFAAAPGVLGAAGVMQARPGAAAQQTDLLRLLGALPSEAGVAAGIPYAVSATPGGGGGSVACAPYDGGMPDAFGGWAQSQGFSAAAPPPALQFAPPAQQLAAVLLRPQGGVGGALMMNASGPGAGSPPTIVAASLTGSDGSPAFGGEAQWLQAGGLPQAQALQLINGQLCLPGGGAHPGQ
jgi:hypothetical protein